MFPDHDCSQTVNTVGAVGSIVGAYTYIHTYIHTYIPLCTYIMLYYAYTFCIYYACISIKSPSQDHKVNTSVI